MEVESAQDFKVYCYFDQRLWLGIICRPNHADQWNMDRYAVDQKGTFCRPSYLADQTLSPFVFLFLMILIYTSLKVRYLPVFVSRL